MSLDISRLKNVRTRGDKTTAGCPACAEVGHDRKCEHLVINAEGGFGCVVYPGNGPEAKEHRRRIFMLCGDRKIKPLVICRATGTASLGRLGRQLRSHSQDASIKAGLLGRLGRVFDIHARRHAEGKSSDSPIVQQNDIATSVLAVPESEVRPNRPPTEHELSILRRAGAENDPLIITALNLFNATIVE